MANRVIRDYTASESVDGLSQGAEIFFMRFMLKADDYGNYNSNVKLIRSTLYPLKDLVTITEVEGWLEECLKCKIIRRYTVDGKDYLHIPNFDQKLRRMKEIYPKPPDGYFLEQVVGQVRTNDGQTTAEKKGREVESETEEETESESESARIDSCWLLEESLKNGLDEIYLDGQRPKWGHVNFDFELNTFKEKVRGSPDDYRSHDVNGIRKAFQYQLRNAKIKKNGTGFTDKRAEATRSLAENFIKRANDGDNP